MRLVVVVGARPNFMKMAPVLREARRCEGMDVTFVHTGQHYDAEMCDVFLKDLELPQPDVSLGVGSGSHAQQTAKVMVAFESLLSAREVHIVLVGGDVNSTLACALVASKLHVRVAHIEAGLRSFDRSMPEEINRVVTDSISDLLFTTCEDADANLQREGIPRHRIFFVGNTMIDSLLTYRNKAFRTGILANTGVEEGKYALLTLHRPSNVDAPEVLGGILDAFRRIQNQIKVVFPIHPRTAERLQTFGLMPKLSGMGNLRPLPPLGYLEFLALMAKAKLVLTDSGGIQEETTILGVPCVTLRWNTERPVTLREGTNVLVGNDPSRIISAVSQILDGSQRGHARPKLWDGMAAKRIVEVIKNWQPPVSRGPQGLSGVTARE